MMNFIMYIENLASNGTASQNTTYYYESKNKTLPAYLAINGGPTDTFGTLGCSVTWWKPFIPIFLNYLHESRFTTDYCKVTLKPDQPIHHIIHQRTVRINSPSTAHYNFIYN
jgi:hypothetical protein